MTIACIGLGSNLGDPVKQVREGITALDRMPDTVVLVSSSLYCSKPLGPPGQPDYINAAVRLDTGISADQLLLNLQQIEYQFGRDRSSGHWGPRTLDLDILTYGDQIIISTHLTVPHPEIPNRNFVLYPLVEIDCNMEIPGMGRARDLLDKTGTFGLTKLEQDE
jgi:2-amino-4-hydroxy-6-hydroxymethyldihydropteridine diphosphokinase